jgi:uncharacterized protein with WD repeat
MPGPASWNGAKKRRKRPLTAEARASASQDTGKVLRDPHSRRNAQTPLRKVEKKIQKSGDEKRLRALNKKLREIEALTERQGRGEELDEQQQQKLESMGSVLEQMAELGVPGLDEG